MEVEETAGRRRPFSPKREEEEFAKTRRSIFTGAAIVGYVPILLGSFQGVGLMQQIFAFNETKRVVLSHVSVGLTTDRSTGCNGQLRRNSLLFRGADVHLVVDARGMSIAFCLLTINDRREQC